MLNYRASATTAAIALRARTGPLMLRAAGAALRKELEPALAAPTGLTSVVESSAVESSESVVVVVVEPPVSELVEEALGEEADPVEVEVEPPVKQEESEEALTVIC